MQVLKKMSQKKLKYKLMKFGLLPANSLTWIFYAVAYKPSRIPQKLRSSVKHRKSSTWDIQKALNNFEQFCTFIFLGVNQK